MKLKYHRLKPGGVCLRRGSDEVKYHRLKPGGVRCALVAFASFKIERPPAKARWCVQRNYRARNSSPGR
jgi:hypothetical protein